MFESSEFYNTSGSDFYMVQGPDDNCLLDFKLEEGTGTNTLVAGTEGAIGTINNATWTSVFNKRNALVFNNPQTASATATDNVTTLNNHDFDTGPFTIEVWFKPNFTVTSNDYCLVSKGWGTDGASYPGWVLYWDASIGWTFRCGTGSASDTVTLPSPSNYIRRDTWYHMIALRDGVNLKIWVYAINPNGYGTTLLAYNETTDNARDTTSGQKVKIGSANAVFERAGFPGTISRVRIYDTALTNEQIKDIVLDCNNKKVSVESITTNSELASPLLRIDASSTNLWQTKCGSATTTKNFNELKIYNQGSKTLTATMSSVTGGIMNICGRVSY